MEKEKYFSTLLDLYEAVNAEENMKTNEAEMQQQQKIADTGSDVNDPNVQPEATNSQEAAAQMAQQQGQVNNGTDDENPEGLQDAAYLTSTSGDVAPTAQSGNTGKLVKLFELMQNLSLYADSFRETLDTVELGLLDDSILEEVQKYRDALDDLTTKIHDYLVDVFSTDSYEKALYAYIMFRTELLVATKQLRELLKLNEVDDEEKN